MTIGEVKATQTAVLHEVRSQTKRAARSGVTKKAKQRRAMLKARAAAWQHEYWSGVAEEMEASGVDNVEDLPTSVLQACADQASRRLHSI